MIRILTTAILFTAASAFADNPAGPDAKRGEIRVGRVSLFGLTDEKPVRSVVFVSDHSDELNPVSDLVKAELIRAVEGLVADQQFNLLWFSEGEVVKLSDKLRPATDDNKAAFRKHLNDVTFKGSVDPRGALFEALALKPDVIYVLTDGNFEPEFVGNLTKKNGGKTRIHTIGLVLPGGEGHSNLAKMAKDNGGQFKAVDAVKLLEKPGGKK